MPSIADTAICVRHWDYSETSQTVSLFCREHGVIRGLAKGSKREKGNFSGGIELLTRGEVLAIIKPGRDLATLTAWHLQEVYWALRQRLDANRIGFYMADLVNHLITDHDPHPILFDALAAALAGLENRDEAGMALLRFQWSLLLETGYQPRLETHGGGNRLAQVVAFDARSGGVIDDLETPDAWRVRRETIEVLQRIAAGEAVHDPAGSVNEGAGKSLHESVLRANRLLGHYIREIVGREMPTMQGVFGSTRTGR